MFKKSVLGSAIAFAIAAPTLAMAEVETSVVLKNETAVFIKEGIRTHEATSQLDENGDGRKIGKFENSARIFFNGDVGEDSSWHGELKLIYDAAAEDGYKGHKNYTQNDWLRELYVDTTAGGWDLRLGKQQVVWGTADGIKLLDIINPTDYREVVQNTMEDSRIPVWMINAERYIGDGSGNIQLIVAQAEENKIPGLNGDGDVGHGFVMKGVDTITGKVNGFVNIAPALGLVSNSFHNFATFGSFTGGVANPAGLAPFTTLSVDGFAAQDWTVTFAGTLPLLAATTTPSASNTASASNPLAGGPGVYSGNPLLNTFANDTPSVGPNSNAYQTNLTNIAVAGGAASTVTWGPTTPSAAFEYMPNATFATFNTFAGDTGTGGIVPGMTTRYVKDMPSDFASNAGFRYRGYTDGGVNYSVNYFYHYDSNPAVDINYFAADGTPLTTELRLGAFGGLPTGAVVARDSVASAFDGTTVLLTDGTSYYGAVDPMTGGAGIGTGVIMEFREYHERIHSLGGSFDMAIDSLSVPLVVRGEFLYDKDTLQPVVDKRLLGIGDLEGALKMQEADMFKYVIGVDATVLTNMMASFQFIQFRNLDYVDNARTCTTQFGSRFDCSEYTADFATMHLSNGLQKAWKNKEFYSFFLSKPFGDSDLGRWNNIIMYEEGGGYWDRLDAEYSVSDQLVVTGEVNMYWGDEDTQFGQFKNSSNVQVGLKYIIE